MSDYDKAFHIRENSWRQRLFRDIRLLLWLTKFVIGFYTVGYRIRRKYLRKRAAGEPYWLDDQAATGRPYDLPIPELTFRYHNAPRSGNEVSGVGENTWRRPSKVHSRLVCEPLDKEPRGWKDLEFHFGMIQGIGMSFHGLLGVLRQILVNRWQLRRADGPVAEERVVVSDPEVMSDMIRSWIRERYPEALVGFTNLTEEAVFENISIPYKYAVCIGLPMNREEVKHAKKSRELQTRALQEVWRVYSKVSLIAIEIAEYIRSLGWPAKAYGETKASDILHVPLAVNAGLGELGKHGSILSLEYGSNFRLSTAVTDLPLALDAPVDIGVEDLCAGCRRCTIDCPPQAISDSKQMIRGEMRWHVDFDKCMPYFSEYDGCSICIQVCPWSKSGRGSKLSEKLLSKRVKRSEAA